ncbi:hypothetical protein ACXR8F_03575 [Terrabacter sp. AAH1]
MTNNSLHSVPRCLRTATSVVAACVALTVPAASAGASPAPDPHPANSSHLSTRDAVDHLRQAYRQAPLAQKLGVHEEIALLLATEKAAL